MQNKNIRVGIIAAMKIEAYGLIDMMTESTVETVSGTAFHSGKINGVDCVVAVCGIGKVFAAICTQTMILKYSPDLIINSGVAGTLTDRLSIGNIIVADKLVQHDMDTSAIGDPVGLISGINVIYLPCDEKYSSLLAGASERLGETKTLRGIIASGDKFISCGEDKKRIKAQFDASACEMEGAAVAHVCCVNGTPCCVMRAISDGGDENASMDYPAFARLAAERGIRVLAEFLKNI